MAVERDLDREAKNAHARLRVEQALPILPEIEALAPLRAFLIGASEVDEHSQWASSAPYLTVGKRRILARELRRRLKQILRPVADHLALLYEAVFDALECQERGDTAGAVTALLRAGGREEAVGRVRPARAWYERALRATQGLRDRTMEMEALTRLGRVNVALGDYATGSRCFQRSLALAEAESRAGEAVAACEGLGQIAVLRGALNGAEAWYRRGLALVEGAGDDVRAAALLRNRSVVALRKGDTEAARDWLEQAQARLGEAERGWERVHLANTRGLVEAACDRFPPAEAAHREALAILAARGGDPALETATHLYLAGLYLEDGRFLQAEEAARRAEELAIEHNLLSALVEMYVVLGQLRGRQDDEHGFVFFEKAVELCRLIGGSPLLEGRVLTEYGLFRARLGDGEEARARLEQARTLLESIGEVAELERVRHELDRLRG